jgi:hypothetical protein
MYGIAKLWFHFTNYLQKEGNFEVLKKEHDTDEEHGAWAGGGEQEPGEEGAHAGEDEGVAPPLSVTQHQLHVLVLPATQKKQVLRKILINFPDLQRTEEWEQQEEGEIFKNFWAWYTKGCEYASL